MTKFYQYISESKLDMIFPQMPKESKEKISLELGINLHIFSAKFKSDSELNSEDNLITKNKLVSKYIIKNENNGKIGEDCDWIYEKDVPLYAINPKNGENIILFISKLNDYSYLVLGGSKTNVIGGNIKISESSSSFSYEQDIIEHLDTVLNSSFYGIDNERHKIRVGLQTVGDDIAVTEFDDWQFGSIFNVVNFLVENQKFPPQNKSFLAKKFITTTYKHKKFFEEDEKEYKK